MRLPAKAGFTLIEILVAVSLIVILTSVSLPSFNTFTKRQRLIQAAKDLKSHLRGAQSKALAGVGQSFGSCGWGITTFGTGQGYDVCLMNASPTCSNVVCVAIAKDQVVYPSEISISPNVRVWFSFINGSVSPAVFTLSSGTNQRAVQVGQGGSIDDYQP